MQHEPCLLYTSVTAHDFVDSLAYVLNPDYASSTASLVTPYVAGADDYYNYCEMCIRDRPQRIDVIKYRVVIPSHCSYRSHTKNQPPPTAAAGIV